MISKIGKLQKQVINILKENHECNADKLKSFLNIYPSELNRILYRLEKKRLIAFNKDKILVTEYERSKKLCNKPKLQAFYFQLRDKRIFNNQSDFIVIETQANFISIFYNSIDDNESLQLIRVKDKERFKKIYINILENLNNEFKALKERIEAWSNNKIKVLIKNNYIQLIKNNSVLILKENDYIKLDSECTFILLKGIIELNNLTMTIASKDYTNFSPSSIKF